MSLKNPKFDMVGQTRFSCHVTHQKNRTTHSIWVNERQPECVLGHLENEVFV
jgi:hypothetical protein